MKVLHNARVVVPGGTLEPGWVAVEGGRIAEVGSGPAPPAHGGQAAPADAQEVVDLGGQWLLPGYIDIHVHGGGGSDSAGSPEGIAGAVAFHRRHGTTRTLVSFASAPAPNLARQLGWVADMVEAGPGRGGHVVGAHLEGPFLSNERRGAHNPEYLLAPDRKVFAGFVEASRGTLRSVTIAPELPGALDLIKDALGAGAVAAIGHSDATYAQARAGIDAGATVATHLFNGMRPVHHREPGIVWAALLGGIACEVINDGVHVHPAVTSLVASVPERLVFVTDAVQVAGLADGDHQVGERLLHVAAGHVTLSGTGTLAGSCLTMDAAVRRAVTECGVPIEVASMAASGNPARALGLYDECGAIAPGRAADLVVLDDDLQVVRVMADGRWD